MFYISNSLKQTKYWAKRFGTLIFKKRTKNLILISGELGAGKTTFLKYFFYNLGVRERLFSPTFILAQRFVIKGLNFYHLDLYRLNNYKEILQLINIKKELDHGNYLLIEWGEKLLPYIQKYKLPFSQLFILKLIKRKRLFYLINYR